MNLYTKEPQKSAKGCVIWMHGLGADASDMEGLVQAMPTQDLPLRHVFMNAPPRPITLNAGMVMPAWYDILGMQLQDRADIEGIAQSEKLIRKVMQTQLEDGFSHGQIFLAGFSQGGAMALHTALNTKETLGGVIALSAYLPLGTQTNALLDKDTPLFIATGLYDPLVLPAWTRMSKDFCLKEGYKHISFYEYPMEHSVCLEEIQDIDNWLTIRLQGAL